jgi:predicted alpha/beta superfamily hydrolase
VLTRAAHVACKRLLDRLPGDAKGSGEGPKFLAFLKSELIPLIEANYRADPARRILGGHSFGGLFTLYAMFTDLSMAN